MKARLRTIMGIAIAGVLGFASYAYAASEFPGLVFSKVTPSNFNGSSGSLPTSCAYSLPTDPNSTDSPCGNYQNYNPTLICVFNQSHQGIWLTLGYSGNTYFNAEETSNFGYVPPGSTFSAVICSNDENATEFYMGGLAGHEFEFSGDGVTVNNNSHLLDFGPREYPANNVGEVFNSETLPGYYNTSVAPGQPPCETPSGMPGLSYQFGNLCLYGLDEQNFGMTNYPNAGNLFFYAYIYATTANAGEKNNGS